MLTIDCFFFGKLVHDDVFASISLNKCNITDINLLCLQCDPLISIYQQLLPILLLPKKCNFLFWLYFYYMETFYRVFNRFAFFQKTVFNETNCLHFLGFITSQNVSKTCLRRSLRLLVLKYLSSFFLMSHNCAFTKRTLADYSFILSFVSVGKINAVISFLKYFVFVRFVLS